MRENHELDRPDFTRLRRRIDACDGNSATEQLGNELGIVLEQATDLVWAAQRSVCGESCEETPDPDQLLSASKSLACAGYTLELAGMLAGEVQAEGVASDLIRRYKAETGKDVGKRLTSAAATVRDTVDTLEDIGLRLREQDNPEATAVMTLVAALRDADSQLEAHLTTGRANERETDHG